jgi:hypothetical protein
MFVGEKTLAHLNGRFLPGVNHWALFS